MLVKIARILLGLVFVVFGLNGFLMFIPVPEVPPIMQLLVESQWLSVVKALEILCGLALIVNRFVPAALVVLGAIILNIAVYHITSEPTGLPALAILLPLYAILVYAYRDHFKPLLTPKAEPAQP